MAESLEPSATPYEAALAEVVAPAQRRDWAGWTKAGFVTAGVLAPLNCFLTAAPSGIPQLGPWQSGFLDVYAGLLVAWRPSLLFYPLLAYSMACLMLLTFGWRQYQGRWIVRWGVYCGVLLALHYWLIMAVHLAGSKPLWSAESLAILLFWAIFSLIAAAVSLGMIALLNWLTKRIGMLRLGLALTSILFGGFVIWLIVLALNGDHMLEVLFVPPGSVWVLSLFLATPWAGAAYGSMAYSVWKSTAHRQWTLSEMLGAISWGAFYFGAWRVALTLMLEDYAKLPTTQPGCYIATAAARGHRRWVGSEWCEASSGPAFAANDQLRWLKLGELVLAFTCPAAHRRCRAVYDRLGPGAARSLAHPLLADAAYLLLKPAEWGVRLLLALLLPQAARWARRLYPTPTTSV